MGLIDALNARLAGKRKEPGEYPGGLKGDLGRPHHGFRLELKPY